ncbi:hypothetical protein [Sphingomonas sanguinis]|uniref:hypothetical protein n=1 Tax=Sphingomonas sanguinis TaxID=33051 RepID=UPI003019A300
MTDIPYARFQQALGDIIIKWAVAEEHFRQLLTAVAGLEPLEGEIIFDRVAAGKQREILMLLGKWRHCEAVQGDLAFCARLHAINGANRNLFAHGHIGFGTMGDQPPKASRIKLQLGNPHHNRMWEIEFSDVLRIADDIQLFDHYARYLAFAISDDRHKPSRYVGGLHRPNEPIDHSKEWTDLGKICKDEFDF